MKETYNDLLETQDYNQKKKIYHVTYVKHKLLSLHLQICSDDLFVIKTEPSRSKYNNIKLLR